VAITDVAPGELAAVVTWLEMRERPRLRPFPASPLRLVEWPAPSATHYRTLFARVGTPWLWFSRLLLEEAALVAILHDARVELRVALDARGIEVGLIELDFRHDGACEIAFLGLIPELAGQGHGRWLMAHALALAWRKGVERVFLHTCTLDHASALGFYRKQGFTAYRRGIETFADPRLLGILPRDCAPQIPLID
jgi:GNAT superfamily N-acetyltransferase